MFVSYDKLPFQMMNSPFPYDRQHGSLRNPIRLPCMVYCSPKMDYLTDANCFLMRSYHPTMHYVVCTCAIQYSSWARPPKLGLSVPLRGAKAIIYHLKAYHLWISNMSDIIVTDSAKGQKFALKERYH